MGERPSQEVRRDSDRIAAASYEALTDRHVAAWYGRRKESRAVRLVENRRRRARKLRTKPKVRTQAISSRQPRSPHPGTGIVRKLARTSAMDEALDRGGLSKW